MTHTVSPLSVPSSKLWDILEYIKQGVAQHPQLALSNSPNKEYGGIIKYSE